MLDFYAVRMETFVFLEDVVGWNAFQDDSKPYFELNFTGGGEGGL